VIWEPQSGKTGIKQELIDRFVDDCLTRKRTFQIIVLCGLPQLDLADQTRKRLTESAIYDGTREVVRTGAKLDEKARATNLHCYPPDLQKEGIVVRHNNVRLRKMDLNVAPADVRLWIVDEVHLGSNLFGNLDRLLKQHGVQICKQIHTWDNRKTINHFVGISATPSAHLIQSDYIHLQGPSLFHVMYESPGPDYNGLERMRDNGRLKQTEPLFVPSSALNRAEALFEDQATMIPDPSDFWLQVQADFRRACKEEGPGYLVIRATGRHHVQLMNYINDQGRRIECEEFDAHKLNIDQLNERLSKRPTEPTFVVIRGSMRAGITLGLKHYIRGWVETRSTNADAPTQSGAGRACGYGKIADKYPIYCDLPRVQEWIRAYDDLKNGRPVEAPSGVQNKGTLPRRPRAILQVREILPYAEAYDKYVKPNTAKNREKRERSDPLYKYRTQISKTADNVFLDVADMFLAGRHDSGSALGIYLNGPTSKETVKKYIQMHSGGEGGRRKKIDPKIVWGWYRRNHRSYQRLLKAFPHAVGLVIVTTDPRDEILAGNIHRVSEHRNDFQKETSALKIQASSKASSPRRSNRSRSPARRVHPLA